LFQNGFSAQSVHTLVRKAFETVSSGISDLDQYMELVSETRPGGRCEPRREAMPDEAEDYYSGAVPD